MNNNQFDKIVSKDSFFLILANNPLIKDRVFNSELPQQIKDELKKIVRTALLKNEKYYFNKIYNLFRY
jgi:hypothetical protein